MIPVLFPSDATTFTTQGLGALTDTLQCYVEEERNGIYEGVMTYPITGIHYDDIGLRSIIVAKSNYNDGPQPFRVYDISKPINGVVTIRFQHISYDLSGYPAAPFIATTLATAMSGLVSNCPVTCPFTLSTTRTVTATFTADVPASIRSWMGGKRGSLLDIYGGEWHYDKFTAELPVSRGQNRGVVIRYGKNLLNLNQEENCAALYTGVYPYWVDAFDGTMVTLTQKVVNNTETPTYSGATYNFDRILPLDLSDRWETAPTQTQLKDAAKAYIETNLIGTPKVNLTVDFFQYSQAVQDRVDLCDTVAVQFPALGVSATAKCIKTKWNVLLDRYDELKLGDAKTTIADTIAGTQKTANDNTAQTAAESSKLQRVAYYDSGKIVLDGDKLLLGGTEVGSTLSAALSSSLTLTSGSTTDLCSITLTPGTWVVTAQYHCPVTTGDSFRIIAAISTLSSDYQLASGGYVNTPVINPPLAAIAGTLARIITVAANTPVYLTMNQNSGGNKTLTANRNRIAAVFIAA